jgi:hypothetical protein
MKLVVTCKQTATPWVQQITDRQMTQRDNDDTWQLPCSVQRDDHSQTASMQVDRRLEST